jgi:hypothetical protein
MPAAGDVADDHRLVDRLHHVVHRQRGDRHRRQRFHLDARRRRGPHARFDLVTARGGSNLHVRMRNRQRVAQGDQGRGLLRRHDAGEPRRFERISLFQSASSHLPQRLFRHGDRSPRHCLARGRNLPAHIHHSNAPYRVHVRQFSCSGFDFGSSSCLFRLPSFFIHRLPLAQGRTTSSRATWSNRGSSVSRRAAL